MKTSIKSPQILKLYISNFLTGFVFWYGIEKLFMSSIGINPLGIGLATATLTIFLVLFDIPAGVLADKWSRKGVLVVSSLALAASSWVGGISHSLTVYLICELFYGVYVVSSSGTYQAIIYDSLHEENRADQYSKINGRIWACFMIGAGMGDILSGFIAHRYGYRASYFLTIIPCLLNVLVTFSLHEPRFHEASHKEKMLSQLGGALRVLAKAKLVRSLVVVMSLFAIIELFKLEYGQLYFLRYTHAVQAMGILWAVYAFAMALGSVIAHKFRSRLDVLIFFSVIPLVCMSLVDNKISVALFMVQAVAAAALLNQIETRIQENTPSGVRASVLSVVTTLGRIVAIPASFILGWLFRDYTALVALYFVSIIGVISLLYWLLASRMIPKANKSMSADGAVPITPDYVP
jgi:MFS family permease